MTKKENKMFKVNKILEAIKSITIASTAHGVSHFSRTSRTLLKLMWFILSLFSVSLCIYFVSLEVLKYLKFETETKIKIINEQQVDFPSISFCNVNGKLKEFNIVIKKCEINLDKSCQINYEKYFTTFYDPIYGKCYRLSQNEQKTIITAEGNLYGLHLELNSTFNTTSINELILHIHNRSLTPSSLLNNGYLISFGSRNYFSLKRTFFSNLDYPYSNCLKEVTDFKQNKTIINFILNRNRTYTQTECNSLCNYLKIIELSSCRCGLLKKLDLVLEDCYFNSTDRNCIQDFVLNFQKNHFQACAEYCPLECDSMSFTIKTSLVNILSTGNINNKDFITDYYTGYETYDQVRQNFIAINVYYETLKYTLITQEPKLDLSGLISNIGGLLGIFIGLSFLSFFELIEIILEISFIIFEKKTSATFNK